MATKEGESNNNNNNAAAGNKRGKGEAKAEGGRRGREGGNNLAASSTNAAASTTTTTATNDSAKKTTNAMANGGGGGAGGGKAAQQQSQRPSVAARDAKLKEIDDEIARLKAERDKVAKAIQAAVDASKEGGGERQEARAKVNKLREEFEAVKAQREAAAATLKRSQENLDRLRAEEKKMKESLKFSTVEEIDQEIARLEDSQRTSALALKDEKALVRQIEQLRAKKRDIGGLKTKKDEMAKANEARREAEQKANECRAAANEVFTRLQKARDELTALEERSRKGGDKIPELREQREALNTKVDEAYKTRNRAYEEWRVANDAFHKAEQERRKAEEERKKAEREEQARLAEEARLAREAEEAKQKPWEKEIAACDGLLAHLYRLAGMPPYVPPSSSSAAGSTSNGETTPVAAAPTSKVSSAIAPKAPRQVTVDKSLANMKPLQRGQDDDYFSLKQPSAPSSSSSSSSAPAKDPNRRVNHSLDMLNLFMQFSLSAPQKEGDLEKAIADVKAKRDYYDVLPRPPKKPSAPTTTEANASSGASPSSSQKQSSSSSSFSMQHQSSSNDSAGESASSTRSTTSSSGGDGGRKSNQSSAPAGGDHFPTLPGSAPPRANGATVLPAEAVSYVNATRTPDSPSKNQSKPTGAPGLPPPMSLSPEKVISPPPGL